MKKFKQGFKRHIGMIIVIIILLVFPTSLTNQAKLNMRIIVTGVAVDKADDGYEITAQIVKTTPGTESAGTSATLDFISDSGETIAKAISKLSYKAGKVSAFSHTNFIMLGKDILSEEITQCLDYFIRDNVIKNSTLILFAEDKAGEEIKKTKNIELSVGLGLQRVFIFKERESDGLNVTALEFLNANKMFSKTAFASVFSLKSAKDEEGGDSGGSSSGSPGDSSSSGGGLSSGEDSGGSSSGSSGGGSGESTSGSGGSGNGNGGSSGGSSGSSSGGSGSSSGSGSGSSGGSGGEETMFFQSQTPIFCFVGGKYVGKIEEENELFGFMMAQKKSKTSDIVVSDMECERLKGTKITISIKQKSISKKIRYENGTPCLDICVKIKNAEVDEVLSEKIVSSLTPDEFECLKQSIEKKVAENIGACFSRAKSFGADVFGAYELACKFKHGETAKMFDSVGEFVDALKINVKVEVVRLEY